MWPGGGPTGEPGRADAAGVTAALRRCSRFFPSRQLAPRGGPVRHDGVRPRGDLRRHAHHQPRARGPHDARRLRHLHAVHPFLASTRSSRSSSSCPSSSSSASCSTARSSAALPAIGIGALRWSRSSCSSASGSSSRTSPTCSGAGDTQSILTAYTMKSIPILGVRVGLPSSRVPGERGSPSSSSSSSSAARTSARRSAPSPRTATPRFFRGRRGPDLGGRVRRRNRVRGRRGRNAVDAVRVHAGLRPQLSPQGLLHHRSRQAWRA